MKYKRIFFSVVIFFLMLLITSCGNSASNTPAQAVNDFYQSFNNKNCDKNLGVRSVNFTFSGKAGASRDEEIRTCQQILNGFNPNLSVTINDVRIEGNKAEIKEDLTFTSQDEQETHKNTVLLVVEDGEWKIDSIRSDDKTSQS